MKTITVAYGFFEHTQEPAGKKDYTPNPTFRQSHKFVALISVRL